MTPEERTERERRELIYRRHAEMQVIQLAIKHVEIADYGPDLSLLIAAIKDLERRYARTGAPLAEAFEREAEALVRQLDAPHAELAQWGRDMAAHPSDPSRCVNALGERSAPQDCVIEHLAMNREQRRLELEVLEANALHYESQTEVSAGRAALEIDGVGTGPVLRERVSRLADYHGSITHLQADIDQELSEYRPAPEPTGALRLDGTLCGHYGCGGHMLCQDEPAGNPDELIWHPRTMKDARKGDQIRPAGSDMPNGTAVTDRYWPPQPAVPTRYGPLPADRDTWHVVPGAKHWDDHVVQPGEVWLRLDGGAPRNVDPDFPIEILLTRAEIAAIELLGWDSREELRS